MPKPLLLLEASDVGRLLNVVAATVRYHVRAGRLIVRATTPRGVQLFDPRTVGAFARTRAAREWNEAPGRRRCNESLAT